MGQDLESWEWGISSGPLDLVTADSHLLLRSLVQSPESWLVSKSSGFLVWFCGSQRLREEAKLIEDNE